MRESPRVRRLRTDQKAMRALRADSTILNYREEGDPAERYLVQFQGAGFWQPAGGDHVVIRRHHEVRIELGASYPRMMPGLSWVTPIFHPNISANGIVCLGGYGTHWVPSLNLDELCEMLWDMVRYENFDVDSPYNREAALWARAQTKYQLPIDSRPIRDKVATAGQSSSRGIAPESMHQASGASEVIIIDDNVVDAEVVEPEDQDIFFLD